MATVELKKLVMAGPMRWIALTTAGNVTTLVWFVKVLYTTQGGGTALFARSDLYGLGHDDLFAVFGDNLSLAKHLRDDIFGYSAFAGVPGQMPPAPVVEATFESQGEFPGRIVESMRAVDGTTLSLLFYDLGSPTAYVRAVSEKLIEVGAYAVPAGMTPLISSENPAGQAQKGPLAEAPPLGADLQNLWYERG